MVSWSDSLAARTLSDSIRLDRRLKLFSAQFISMNKFRSFLARIWLPEPEPAKFWALRQALSQFTEVKLKETRGEPET